VICKKCRLEYPGEALFCPNCGTAKARDESGDPMLGTTIGDRYLLIDRLGQGASGTIYRAEHITLRRKVAVKVLHHELSRDDLAIERFRREATTVGQIENDHIVEIFDFGRTSDGRLYLAMELLEGETLADLLERERPVPVETAVDILIQVGEALMEAHAMGYVHRDLRPRNIFLAVRRGKGGKPFVKLLDFGLAKLVEKEGEAASTSLGMTFGDPHYMSPEQARGDSIDRRADIYSLGCIAYQMLVGEPPFTGGKVFDILTRHVDAQPVDAAVKRPDLPTWLSRAVMRMLAKRADERFITVYRVVEALRQGADSGLIMSDEIARRQETSPPPSVSQAMAKLSQRSASELEAAAAEAPPTVKEPAPPTVKEPAPPTVKEPAPPTVKEPGPPVLGARTVLGVGMAGGMSVAEAVARAGATAGPGTAVGKGASRGNAPASSTAVSALSAAWFADGEAMEDGADLDESVRRRLERARSRGRPSTGTGLMNAEVARESRQRWKLAAAIGVVIVLIAAGALALSGGGDDEDEKKVAAKTAAPAEKKKDTALTETSAPAPAPVVTPPPAAEPPAPVPPPTPEPKAASPEPPKSEPAAPKSEPKSEPAPRKSAPSKTASVKPAKTSKKGRFDSIGAEPMDPYADQPPADEPKSEPKSEGKAAPDSGKADFYAKLGDSDLANGDFLGAATNFNKARELDPNNLTAIMGLGEIALSQGSTAAAIAHLKKATKLKSSSARAHTLLGEAYLAAGQKSNAAASFKKALKIDPDNARARDGYNEATGE
jgi:serine/threonine-protein kinase